MDDTPLSVLFSILGLLILCSAFFASSETGMMALNRYRLRHLAKGNHRGARLAEKLLQKPDRLIGLILFGNNLVNIFAASLATVIAMRLYGELGLAIAPVALTVVILIFAEVAPKTVAVLKPERIAFPAAYILTPLGKFLYPAVWVINRLANSLLAAFGIRADTIDEDPITPEELRTIVMEAGTIMPRRHQRMLLSILDLEKLTVDEIMVPRSEIIGIDLDDDTTDIIELLTSIQHTRMPVFRENIDEIVGMLHARRIPRLLKDRDEFSKEAIVTAAKEPYFVPLGTQLNLQLLNFQREKKRIGLVVDEYGVIQGLVTLEDILEEIIGEFTTDMQSFSQDIQALDDGSYVIAATATIRDINKQLQWNLPSDGPRTLNGLLLEQMETIPEPGTSLRIGRFAMEVTQATENAIRTVRVYQLSDNGRAEPGK